MNNAKLLDELQLTLNRIDDQMNVLADRHREEQRRRPDTAPKGTIHDTLNAKGQPVLMELTVAKANVLLAITQLQMAEKAQIAAEDSDGVSSSTDGNLTLTGVLIHENNAVALSDMYGLDWGIVQHKLDVAQRLRKRVFFYPGIDTFRLL